MIRLFSAAMLAAGLCATSPVLANAIQNPSLEDHVAQSDLVVVGQVQALQSLPNGERYAQVAVRTLLKGVAPSDIDVWTSTRIAEADPRCCTVGASYVFFLTHGSDEKYTVVAGYHGAQLIPDAPIKWEWPKLQE